MKVAILLLIVAGAFASPSAKIHSEVLISLQAAGSANIFVSFPEGTSNALKSLSADSLTNQAEKANGVNSLLRSNAASTQGRILSFLKDSNVEGVRSFWITNQIYIKNASPRIVEALAAFSEVSKITEEKFVPLSMPTKPDAAPSNANEELTWGLIKIQAQDVWNLEGGNQGEGVVVGTIDTGVRFTHEALKDNFAGEYGWLDPFGAAAEPFDDNGHGTHVTGTIAGSKGVGVAPKAKWAACKGCRKGFLGLTFCFDADLLACGEFMQCPTLPDGSNKDCSKAPKIVSNSWGGPGGDDMFKAVVDAWVASDIVPVFANGNRQDSDPICDGVGSPADYENSIGVGSTDIDDSLSSFSQRGPAKSGIIKPDVSAPGRAVNSAWINSDTDYNSISGTSMACPHVAGVAALLASKKPDLTVAKIREYLIYGNEQERLTKPGNNCGGISEDIFPNNAFGHGRISALNAFTKLLQDQN